MQKDAKQMKGLIEARYGCEATHLGTYPVAERVGRQIWSGDVEVFGLIPSLPTQYCYGWMDTGGKAILVPQTPPVISPRTAVRETLKALK